MRPPIVAGALLGWVGVITTSLVFAFHFGEQQKDNTFFCVGPSDSLSLLGVPNHTWVRYNAVVLYTLCSTCFRTLHSEVLSPWIVTRVQTTDAKSEYTLTHARFVVVISVVFTWLDWFMYLNILLTQLDFLLVEVVGNLAVTLYTTAHFVHVQTYTPIQ